jgi:hypothetical protein
MRISCTTTYLHGRDRFEAGDVRTVSDDDARYFIGNGWAAEVGGEAAAATDLPPIALDIQNATHAQEARHG